MPDVVRESDNAAHHLMSNIDAEVVGSGHYRALSKLLQERLASTAWEETVKERIMEVLDSNNASKIRPQNLVSQVEKECMSQSLAC